jgi:predicted transcriptional regulator
MGQVTVRLSDELEERVRAAAGTNLAGWIRGVVEEAVGGSVEVDRWKRHEKRLQALEDWQASALAPPLVRGGLCPPLEKQERTFVPDGQ